MSRPLKILVVAIVLAILLVVAAPFFIPADTWKGRIVAEVEETTGRTLTIDGAIDLSLFPGLELTVGDASLSNAAGASDPVMARMKQLTIGVKWSALFSGKVEITKFILEEPVLNLEIQKNGDANWDFGSDAATSQPETEQEAAPSGALKALSFGDLRIISGDVTLRNGLTGDIRKISNSNLKITMPDLSGAVSIDGDAVMDGETVDLHLALGSLDALSTGEETVLDLELSSRLINASLNGTLEGGTVPRIKTKASIEGKSLRNLAKWVGVELATAKGFGPFSIKGKLFSSGDTWSFTDAQVGLDEMKAKGSLTLRMTEGKPVVSGRLDVDTLDLRLYMKAPTGQTQSDETSPFPAWSEAPIDFSPIKLLDVHFILSTQELFMQNYQIGAAQITLLSRNNTLSAELASMKLYNGEGSGTLEVNLRSAVPQIKAKFAFKEIETAPLVKAAADRDIIEGKGALTLDLSTGGASQATLMSSLQGSGSLLLRDGKLKGVNLIRMLQVISAFTPQDKAATTQEDAATAESGQGKATEFVEMGGTFNIKDGILRTSDFILDNEALSLAGSGQINIGKQSINMRLAPGRRQDDGGMRVKIKVKGPWSDIRYGPDFEDVVKEGLKDLLLGTDRNPAGDPAGDIADKLLNSIFGGKKSRD